MVHRIDKNESLAWRHAYEDGASLYDLEAKEAAKNRRISHVTIGKCIKAVGGAIRTYAETVALKKQKMLEKLND